MGFQRFQLWKNETTLDLEYFLLYQQRQQKVFLACFVRQNRYHGMYGSMNCLIFCWLLMILPL